jgi:hypothetical protein
MADSYLSISEIAKDQFMTERMNAAVTHPAVITDGMILSTIQALGGTPAQPPPEEEAE